ncbi:hypothetical protein THAOC_30094, partial [Thalassiosira oceanica]
GGRVGKVRGGRPTTPTPTLRRGLMRPLTSGPSAVTKVEDIDTPPIILAERGDAAEPTMVRLRCQPRRA